MIHISLVVVECEMKKDYKQEPQKTKNWGSLSSLGAAFGVLFILLGLTALEGAAVGGLMFILIGLLLFPQIKLSRWIKILGILDRKSVV